ncbi:MAG: hypothetical protein WDO13_19275 [Verrucomicrobiota bacterium]
MQSKLLRHPAAGFLLRFVLIFGLLIAPWPGWNAAYAGYFRTVGQWAFSGGGKRLVVFVPNTVGTLDTRLKLGNRDLLDPSGRGLSRPRRSTLARSAGCRRR